MGKVLCPQCGCCFVTTLVTENSKEAGSASEEQIKKEKKAYLEWKDTHSVGIDILDAQHKKLVIIINELHAAINGTSRDSGYVKKLIFDLSTYAKDHFVVEEKMMKETAFPGIEKHILEHRYFIKMIQELAEDYKKSVVSLRNVLAFLNNWFTKHIGEKDKEFAYYYASLGQKAV